MEYSSAHQRKSALAPATWVDPENVMLSEVSLTQKATQCVFPFMRNISSSRIHRDREWVGGRPEPGAGVTASWYRAPFGGDENVPKHLVLVYIIY